MSVRFVIVGLSVILAGCVAQQADVVRIKRELDAKIGQLDKSKTSLQQAVSEANTALEKANSLIAKQRVEIQELLHARAEVMDQVATLKETDLSQVRGGLESNQNQVSELTRKMARYDADMKEVRTQLQQSEPLVHQLRDRLAGEEQLLTEQGGKLGEFRTSLVDYQQVLASLRQQVTQQEQHIAELHKQIDFKAKQHDAQTEQVQANFEEVRRSIQSVVGTLEKVSVTFGGRLDEHEQKLSRVSGQQGSSLYSNALMPENRDLSARSTISRDLLSQRTPLSSQSDAMAGSQASKESSRPVVTGSVATYAPSAQLSRTLPAPGGTSETDSSGPVDTRNAQVLYDRAMSLLRQGNFAEASTGFSTFLRTFADSPLASNAQYWLGECYYGERRFQEAIDEFERVFAFYPSSNKVPASLLKIAYSHMELRELPMARSVFQQLVRTHPQSPEAGKAYGRLQEVNAFLDNPS
ncbi:MAG: tol-pal system protein YbgF [Nitrospirales bacterium]|nr:tol-pal system protein YbgF [Nitrospirales bacterium]